MSTRSVLLTWKMHRFEVLFVVVVLAVIGVSIWVTSSNISGLGLTDACWPRMKTVTTRPRRATR